MNRQAGEQYKEVALHKVLHVDNKVHSFFEPTKEEKEAYL